MIINSNKTFCYRITHRDNFVHILQNGLISKHYAKAFGNFTLIGNPEIIDVRSSTKVKINDYGNIGDMCLFISHPDQ